MQWLPLPLRYHTYDRAVLQNFLSLRKIRTGNAENELFIMGSNVKWRPYVTKASLPCNCFDNPFCNNNICIDI